MRRLRLAAAARLAALLSAAFPAPGLAAIQTVDCGPVQQTLQQAQQQFTQNAQQISNQMQNVSAMGSCMQQLFQAPGINASLVNPSQILQSLAQQAVTQACNYAQSMKNQALGGIQNTMNMTQLPYGLGGATMNPGGGGLNFQPATGTPQFPSAPSPATIFGTAQ